MISPYYRSIVHAWGESLLPRTLGVGSNGEGGVRTAPQCISAIALVSGRRPPHGQALRTSLYAIFVSREFRSLATIRGAWMKRSTTFSLAARPVFSRAVQQAARPHLRQRRLPTGTRMIHPHPPTPASPRPKRFCTSCTTVCFDSRRQAKDQVVPLQHQHHEACHRHLTLSRHRHLLWRTCPRAFAIDSLLLSSEA